MSTAIPEPISRRVFDTARLVAEYPPRISNPNKRVVHRIACPAGCSHADRITFSRWAAMPLPASVEAESCTQFEARPDFFGYEPPPSPSVVEWYLNFSHSHLFIAYDGSLFAQDEMQVAEHPALGSLREALVASDIRPLTVENGEPTPALVMGVERRCRVATDPNPALGRPSGLYGNAFSRASAAAVEAATQAIVPPTISNILAMEAPTGGRGVYIRRTIEYVLATAFTGFVAARIESHRDRTPPPGVIVHTGFWGCGAYGGNRVLMVLLQLLAARLARLDKLVFHTGDASGTRPFEEAVCLLEKELTPVALPVPELLTRIEAKGFKWGVSDGN